MDQGRKRLRAILAERPPDSAHWNEAQNRFQFIDRLLLDVLGWQTPDIRIEQPDGAGGRIDYLLGPTPKAVLEAKREAQHFGDLPTGSPSRVRKIAPLLENSKILYGAVSQVIGYCALQGAKLAIVCNGPQLVIFQAFSPDLSPLKGECFFFNGFASYESDFSLLWKLLSPEGIDENRAYREIQLLRSPRVPPKASESIPEPGRYRYRSDFQEEMRIISALLLEELEDATELKKDFYSNCYVHVEANNRHTLLSKQIIAQRYQRVTGDGTVPSAIASSFRTADGGLALDDAALAKGYASRPIVVLGDVGVGKTSFFENLFFELDRKTQANTFFVHVNLGKQASLSQDIRNFVLDEISRVFVEQYFVDIFSHNFVKSIYFSEIRQFDNSPSGQLKEIDEKEYRKERIAFLNRKTANKAQHVLQSLGHLCHGQQKQILLVLDNADQRDFQTQQKTFLIAQEIAAGGSSLVFLALRPSTFFESKKRGALSGYQNRVFSISPPPADEVVQRRLTFALRIAEGKQHFETLKNIRFRLDRIVAFLRATLRSIRANEKIRIFLNNITGGNTRSVIELVTSFFGSPNVDSAKIVRIESETGRYQVPLHEFTKHALLGEYAHYNPQSSLYACNVFDVSTADSREHFLKPLLIGFLASGTTQQDHDGFVSGDVMVAEALRIGFIEDQTRSALVVLAKNRLIETPHAHFREVEVASDTPSDTFFYRVTSVGLYHLRHWIGTFAFLDAMAIDTPVFEAEIREFIHQKAGSFQIADRFEKANSFRDYLERQWYAADIALQYFDFAEILKAQSRSFDEVFNFTQRSAKDRRR